LGQQRDRPLRSGQRDAERVALANDGAGVRQILGRPGEVWLPESGTEHISMLRTA
jgi:virginiamycin B lyase